LDLNSYGLINYWPIKNNMDDYVGSSHMTYAANNYFSSDRFNNTNSALNFVNGYNIVPSGVYFNGDFTVTLWISYNQMIDWSRILEFSNLKSDVVALYSSWSNIGTPGWLITNGSSNSMNITFSPTLQTNRWYHVAFRFCNTNAKIYVDGVLKVAGSQLVPNNVTRTTNYIGGNSFGDGNLNAKIDDLRIYGRCMSQNEIMNLMNYVNTSPDLYIFISSKIK